jgi:NitT/TauT family transport system substrate-binding protein
MAPHLRRCALLLLLAAGASQIGACKSSKRTVPGLVRIGFFPNITHSQALVGNLEGTFARHLGNTQTRMVQFNAGPAAMEALSSGSLDVSYVGTGPALTFYLKADRQLRVIAAAVNGGAVLVARTAKTPQDLKGKTVASPQLGNTQDVALRYWLKAQGLKIAEDSKGDVTVIPLANPDIVGLFLTRRLEAAWVPEPWGARLIWEAGAHILVDERDLWPNRVFHSTLLVTTQPFLEARPNDARAILRAHVELTRQWTEAPDEFARKTNDAFGQLTSKTLPPPVLKDAFSRLEPALRPLPQVLSLAAKHAQELGFVPGADVTGMVDTSLLDELVRGTNLGTKP